MLWIFNIHGFMFDIFPLIRA